jgi:SAM-dependent methyltransferase
LFTEFHPDIDNYSSDPDKFLAVPFVPTDEVVVEKMLALACVGPKDLLYDLGSGDGRILIAAAKDRSARGIGIDIDPMRIADAMEFAGWAGVEYLVDFIEDDIFTVDFSEATVVTLYLLQSINVQLRPRLLSQLRPGTRIVSHAFDMGDWKADEWIKLSGVNIYKWIVPAPVAGVWEWDGLDGKAYRVELEQKYQEVTGSAWLGEREIDLQSADLCGSSLELVLQEDDATAAVSFTLNFAGNKLSSVSADEN